MTCPKIHFNFGGTPSYAENMTPEALEVVKARRLAFQFEFNRRINMGRYHAYLKRCAALNKLFPPAELDAIGNPWE